MIKKFDKVLIANRGEIACRVIKACKELKIKTVAIFTNGEEKSPHVLLADEALVLKGTKLAETYLNADQIIELAVFSGAQAIHPGYGFLSENPLFAELCKQNKLVFIGPASEVLKKMGDKVSAKKIAQKANVPVLSTYSINHKNFDNEIPGIPYPVLIKAAHGGGGKGMHVVHSAAELMHHVTKASRAAQNYFGNGEVYLEDYLLNARHIEVQVIGDRFGNIVHLYERDCTIQRNHQKIIEEAPAVFLSANLREQILEAAIAICHAVDYENAGTVEFLVDENQRFYFLEMNPRIQVEHPVSEQITGIDIVKEQLLVAAGNPLSFKQHEVKTIGHAIEVRLYAENPFQNFSPSAKPLSFAYFPNQNNIRIEAAIDNTSTALQFDPLLAKIIATGINRNEALSRLLNALDQTVLVGPFTNQNYLRHIINTNAFQQNKVFTNFCQKNHQKVLNEITDEKQKIDQRFIIALALFHFFQSKSEQPNNIWNSINYWRIHSTCNLIIDGCETNLGFSFESDGVKVNQVKNEYTVSIVNISDDRIFWELQIEGINRSFSVVKENEAKIFIIYYGFVFEISTSDLLAFYPEEYFNSSNLSEMDNNIIKSHVHGKIININIKKNKSINKGDVLLVIESMKSEITIMAPKKAIVKKITVEVGEQVTDQMPLVYLEDL